MKKRSCKICDQQTFASVCGDCKRTLANIAEVHAENRLEPGRMTAARQAERAARVAMLAGQAAAGVPLALPAGYEVGVAEPLSGRRGRNENTPRERARRYCGPVTKAG
jgi:hypothetical protein